MFKAVISQISRFVVNIGKVDNTVSKCLHLAELGSAVLSGCPNTPKWLKKLLTKVANSTVALKVYECHREA